MRRAPSRPRRVLGAVLLAAGAAGAAGHGAFAQSTPPKPEPLPEPANVRDLTRRVVNRIDDHLAPAANGGLR